MRRLVVLAGVLGLMLMGAADPAVAGPSDGASPGPPGTDSVAETAVIAGVVVDDAGEGVAGAQVELYVEPRTSEPGTSVLPLVASASTDATGRFSFVAPGTRDVLTRLQDDGVANFLLVVRQDGLILQRNVSRRPSGAIDAAAAVGSGEVLSSARSSRSVGRRTSGLRLVLAPGLAGVSRLPARLPQASAPQCLYSVVSTGRAWTTVGEIHVGGDATGRFTYGRTADSNIDVGFSATGAGGWSVSGTVHVGNTLSATVWAERGPGWGTKFKTHFEF